MPASRARVLTRRALNRAILARQLLLRRARRPLADAIEHLVGLQAQEPRSPYVALAARLDRFDPHALGALLESRDVVRLALMRSTIHLVTARDALRVRPVVQEVSRRGFMTGSPFGKKLAGVDLEAVRDAARELVDAKPRTVAELGQLLGERFPGRDPQSLAYAGRALLALVQIPPRAVWGKRGVARCTTAEAFLGAPLAADPTPDELVLRYLGAFGPASAADAQVWSGLQNLRPVFERLRPQLVTFTDERGRELFDLPDAPRPSPETPAPVRLLPDYDNLLLSHADRSRIIPDEVRPTFRTPDRFAPGTVLIDGFVAGLWTARLAPRQPAVLEIATGGRWRKADREAVLAKAEALLAKLAPDAPRRAVTFT